MSGEGRPTRTGVAWVLVPWSSHGHDTDMGVTVGANMGTSVEGGRLDLYSTGHGSRKWRTSLIWGSVVPGSPSPALRIIRS